MKQTDMSEEASSYMCREAARGAKAGGCGRQRGMLGDRSECARTAAAPRARVAAGYPL